MTYMRSTADFNSLLILLAPQDALHGFVRPDFLHPQFFRHCTTRDQYKAVFQTHATIGREIDVFLPHNAVDLTNPFPTPPSPLRNFYLYCETEAFVTQYKRLQTSKICRRVFHGNQIEIELYDVAHFHLYRYKTNLQELEEEGDVDAGDKLLEVGELFAQSANKINDEIRQKSCLPEQPAEDEEV